MNKKRQVIKDIFTKFGKLNFGVWISGAGGEGEYKSWYSNGQIHAHAFYKNDKLEGEYKYWYKNGQIEEHSFYKNGKLDGEYKTWYNNGEIWEHAFYKDGKVVKKIV